MRLMTVKEMADVLHIKESTVCSLASQGKLPGFKMGKSWRFDLDAVEALFAALPQYNEKKCIDIRKETHRDGSNWIERSRGEGFGE